MRLGLVAAGLVLSGVLACPASARDIDLAPSSHWTLDYDSDSCALRRIFGEGEERVYLELRRFEPGIGLQAVIASSRMKAHNPAEFDYRIGHGAEWHDVSGNVLNMADGYSGVLFSPSLVDRPEVKEIEDPYERDAYRRSIDWQTLELTAAAEAASISLRGAFRNQVSLQTGPLDKPIMALNQCIDELMTHWGIDVEAHKSLTRPAIPTNLPKVPRMIDYPPKMMQQRMQGVVNIRLAIDEKGWISDCHIQMPLSDPAFEKNSCADIQHALEFDPALDKDGKPIASFYVTRVVFQIGR